jgi:uncharacterized protein
MTLPSFLKAHPEGVYLAVKVQPRAPKDAIGQPLGDELKIKVTAAPVEAAANEALLRLLAGRLGCARSAVQLARGHTSRHKVIFVQGLGAEEALRKLAP